MKMPRTVYCFLCTFLIISIASIRVYSENILEYYFVPEKEDVQQNEIKEFFDTFPDEIKENLPDDIASGNLDDISETAREYIDFTNILKKILSEITSALFPTIRGTATIFGIVLIASLINILKVNISSSDINKMSDIAINIGIVLSVIGTEIVTLTAVEEFKDLLCNLMNGMLPILGLVYAASGNAGTAAIQSGGMILLVTICQNLFSLILIPAVRICIMMSVVGAVFPDTGLRHIMIAFRNIATGIILSVTTLFSIVLGMQNSIAQCADSFGARSIKFAIGQLVPIIGGAVSDSLGTISGSLSLLKNAGGIISIVAILFLILPMVISLIIKKFSVYLCKLFAAISGLSNTEKLLDDFGAILSMMIAYVVSIIIAFIYVLTLFSCSSVAFSG